MTKAVTLAELADQNVLTATDNKVGIATTNPQSTLQVGAGITMDGNAGVITAQAYYGDGSNLTGIDATSIKDSNGTVRVQANTSGADVTGNLNVSGVLTYEDVTNVDAVGIITANSGIEVAGIVTAKPGAAVTYYGDGSNLTGIDATALKDSGSTVRVQANTSGVVVTGVLTATSFSGIDASSLSDSNSATRVQATTSGAVVTGVLTATSFSGDGSALTFAPKVVAFDPAALSTGVAANTNITITFDQDIKFFGTGTVELRSTSPTGNVIASFAITSGSAASGLSISGTQLIINPTSNLSENTVVYVILPTNGISNLSDVYYAGSNNYNFRTVQQAFSAEGGTEYTLVDGNSPLGSYRYHIFAGPGILTTTSPAGSSPSLQLLAIGGGGGGGSVYPAVTDPQQGGGGGGAGGYITHTQSTLSLASGTYTVTVGAGGSGGNTVIPDSNPDVQRQGENGGDTTITPPASPTTYLLRAYGGGGGGGQYPGGLNSLGNRAGQPGGSGGGGAVPVQAPETTAQSGGLNIPGQGHAGSEGISYHAVIDTAENGRSAGGGGGAGGSGTAGTGNNRFWNSAGSGPSPYSVGGTGGNGATNSNFVSNNLTTSGLPAIKLNAISANGYYGAGGGGVACGSPISVGGKGGIGGGGNGCNATNLSELAENSAPSNISPGPYPSGNVPQAQGVANATGVGCGGGGGSVNQYAGHGTDGAFMIRYAVPPV